MTLPSPAATASGVSMSVMANPNGAATIKEEQNLMKERRLKPHCFKRSSMVSRDFDERVKEPGIDT